MFAIVGDPRKLTDRIPRSLLRHLVDAAAGRWHMEADDADQAAQLSVGLPLDGSSRTLLQARLDLAADAQMRRQVRSHRPASRQCETESW